MLATTKRPGTPEFHLTKIEEWLSPKLATEARPKASEACLCHHAMLPDGNYQDDIIDRVKVGKDVSPADIAEQLFATAQASIQAHTRPQRYSIVLLENAETPIGRREFLLTPPPSNAFGGDTEPANPQGVLAQIMRHYEANTRLMIMSQQTCQQMFERELERVRKENETLRNSHFEMIKAREDLLDRSADRAMRIRQEQAEMQRGERWVGRAEQLLGAVLENHLGLPQGTVSGPPGSEGASPVARWLGSLSPEQKAKITSTLDETLTDEQAKGFLEVMTQEK